MTREDLLKIQEKIEESKKKKIQADTKLEVAYQLAKEKFGCSTIEEIDKEIAVRDKDLETIESAINEKSKTLEEAYDWNL